MKLFCEPSQLVHFRKRIGQEGVENIFKMTVGLHTDKVEKEDELVADTTVQEANLQFPRDTRLHVDCIEQLWRIGENEGIRWRRSYMLTVPALLARLRTWSSRLAKESRKCRRKIKTIAGRLLTYLRRSVGDGAALLHADELALIERVLR